MDEVVKGQELGPVGRLLSDPKKWCQGALAMDSRGMPTSAWDRDAAQWCLVGACDLAYGFNQYVQRERLRDALYRRDHEGGIGVWNDAPGRTHAEVMDLLRETGV